jgi:sugar fermentation stimulation protein A
MKYTKIIKGSFLSRPNRFIAKVLIDGKEETVHVKNTGRCRELLQPGVTVYLYVSDNPLRKTKYDLIAVEKIRETKEPLLVNLDSQVPNTVAHEWLRGCGLFSESAVIRREVTYGKSRFDFYIEDGVRKIFLEVKGVTLENDGVAMFPDAPTERGIKHINELVSLKKQGYEAFVLFVIQMEEVTLFKPNDITHKAFGDALRQARKEGVIILAKNCKVTEDSIEILDDIEISSV